MKKLHHSLWASAQALMIASSLVLLVQPAVAATRTISNVASVSWNAGTTTRSANSNRVDLDFTDASILQTYVTSSGILPSGALQASCAASGTRLQPGLTSPLSGSILNATQALIAGRSMVLSLTLASANRDPNAVDQITGTVQSGSGDTETVTFIESGPNTGVFLAALESAATPPAPTRGDCRLSVAAGSSVTINFTDGSNGSPLASSTINILIDPYGIAFDSRSGTPVHDVRITLIDTATGQPAVVYGDDGSSIYPSSVIAGHTVTDSGGHIYTFPTGEYRFPLVAPGNYRLMVEPVAPHTFASTLTPTQLSSLRRPDGLPFTIVDGSYGRSFDLGASASVRIDLPLDSPASPLVIAKTVNQPQARSGDLLVYQIDIRNPGQTTTGSISLTDYIPLQMRYRASSARLNHQGTTEPATSSVRALSFSLPPLAAGAHALLSYVLEVRPGATTGDAVNKAQAFADGLASNVSDAVVRISGDDIAERVTVLGRVLGGTCDTNPARGVPGIRVMLEDGSYAVTDRDGRYHLEGLQSGTHVVQIDRGTIPEGAEAIDCANDVRSGGRGTSRFVEGLGGELKRVDFRLAPASLRPAPAPHPATTHLAPFRPLAPPTDASAAGAERDWLVGTTAGIEFLFPAMDYNPRSPVTRVVVKHLPNQHATLFINGQKSAPLAFEGTRKSASGDVLVSIWRGIPLADRSTELKVVVSDARGEIVKTLMRTVVFANVPAHVELLREQSSLVADGVHRPILAFRITDRSGRPVHQGVAGDFDLPAPYFPAIEADAQQARQLAGLERARPTWHVSGDDGIAYVELEPTTASGTVSMRFNFRDGQSTREERLEAWLSPGDRPWTVVGLAEGSFGYNRINKHLQGLGQKTPKDLIDGRLALYAKGKVSGRWLLTLSYDSDEHRRDATFGGTIDPQQYYTVYADRSERRYDAASIRKLYIRLERPQFYALFGDYDTGIDEPVLARYVRSFNGGKTEYRSPQVAATAFVADSPLSHQRDEIQGNGLSGPYTLRSRSILANSERITLQTRDRFRSEIIVNEQILSRHVDYDIDYYRGTLIFRSPVLGRSSSLDPQFIIAEYDVDGHGRSVIDAGGRATWRDRKQRIQVGTTVIHDNDGTAKTDLIGADIKARVTPNTEVRAETALSRRTSDASARSTATAWLMEVEHHDARLDVLGYAGQRDIGFGVGQTNQVESGTRKFGVDLRWHANDNLSVTASAWRHINLADGARSDAARLLAEYRRGDASARVGVTFAHDDLATGGRSTSTLLNLGASKRFDHGRAELGFESEIPLGGSNGVIDFPARHRLTARYAVAPWASLAGSYEIAKSDLIDARTARVGFDLAPWAGAKIALSGNVQDIPEYGRRSFAAFGLAQSIILSKKWSLDFSLDSNKTLGGIDPAKVVNARQPAASGGFVGDGSTITEDYTAVTAGATYRSGRLSITGRAEYRDGEMENRKGFILGAIRQIGEGRALAAGFDWFEAKGFDGARTAVANGTMTWANRPADRALSWLDKFEVRRDAVRGATPSSTDVLGNPLSVVGNARSLRVINSLAINYANPSNRVEASLFWGSRYTSARFGNDDIKGWSNILAGDARLPIGHALDVGVAGTIRYGISAQSVAFSYGPQLNVRPATNTWITLGYNFNGYRDRDFSADRFTRSGAYITLRLKFDELTFQSSGIGGRR